MSAYEVRISDWSSAVCSSDLRPGQFAFDRARLIELCARRRCPERFLAVQNLVTDLAADLLAGQLHAQFGNTVSRCKHRRAIGREFIGYGLPTQGDRKSTRLNSSH